jgi:hypothetical protein
MNGCVDSINISDLQRQGGIFYGMGIDSVSGTDVSVKFGRYPIQSNTTYNSAGADWSAATQSRWRVRKVSGGASVGYPISIDNIVSQTIHEVWVHTGNGFGSTATRRKRFSTTFKNTGTAITYADSGTAGGTFTINQKGIYGITAGNSGSSQYGYAISRNSNGATNPGSLTIGTNRLVKTTRQAGFEDVMSTIVQLDAADVVELIGDTGDNGTTDSTMMHIVLLQKLS